MKKVRKYITPLFRVGSVAGGTAIYAVCQWLILLLFARETMPSEMGAYAYALSISAPFFIFFGFSLRQVYVSDPEREKSWKRYLYLRLFSSALAIIAALLFTFSVGSFTLIFAIVCLIKAVDLIGDIHMAPIQATGRIHYLGIYQALNGIASVCLFALALALNLDAVLALVMSLLGSLISTTFAVIISRPSLRFRTRSSQHTVGRKELLKLAVVAVPLGIAGALNSATQAAPRFILERVDGLESVGIFSAMAYLLIAGNTVVSAIIQYSLPQVVDLKRSKGVRGFRRRILRLSFLMAGLGASAILVISLWGEALINLLYGPGYAHRLTLILLVSAWAIGAVSWVWDMALVVQRAFKIQMIAALLGAVSSILVSILFVENAGLTGAGVAVLLSSVVVALARLVGLRYVQEV